MELAKENSVPFNKKAFDYLAKEQESLVDSLLEMREGDPQNPIIQEVENLGGIGTIGGTLELIESLSNTKKRSLSASNAEFIVALLQSMQIRNYLTDESGGQITGRDLEELRDYFLLQT